MTAIPPSSAAPSDREIAERIALEHDWGALGAPMTLAAEIERALSDARAATERETVERLGDKYALVVANAERYMRAIKTLAQFKDGKTLFEGSPTQDQDCYQAWRELNDSGVALTTAIRQLSAPDPEPTKEPT